jgi:hypothetical protein
MVKNVKLFKRKKKGKDINCKYQKLAKMTT